MVNNQTWRWTGLEESLPSTYSIATCTVFHTGLVPRLFTVSQHWRKLKGTAWEGSHVVLCHCNPRSTGCEGNYTTECTSFTIMSARKLGKQVLARSFPDRFHQYLIACSMQIRRRKAWEIWSHAVTSGIQRASMGGSVQKTILKLFLVLLV